MRRERRQHSLCTWSAASFLDSQLHSNGNDNDFNLTTGSNVTPEVHEIDSNVGSNSESARSTLSPRLLWQTQ